MRSVFLGTPEFSVPALRALAGCTQVAAVFTRPDAASKRGKALHPSPVAAAAEELGLEVHKVDSMRGDEVASLFSQLDADVAVVVAFGELVPAALLDVPRLGFVNVHASALPRWRGAAPVQRAILAGDAEAGVSIMRLEPTLDTGPYCAQATTPVARKNTDELLAELGEMGANLLVEALPAIDAGTAVWTAQDPEQVTYAEKIAKADVLLDPSLGAEECDRRVRASSGAAPARAEVCGKQLTVLAAQPADDEVASGAVLATKKRLVLGCADGALQLDEVKPDGKRAMPVPAFLAGLKRDGGLVWQGVAQESAR